MAWDWESLKVRLAFLLFHQCLMTGMYMLGFLLLFLLHSMFCSRVFFNQKGFVSSAVSVQVIINSHNNKAVVVWFFLKILLLCVAVPDPLLGVPVWHGHSRSLSDTAPHSAALLCADQSSNPLLGVLSEPLRHPLPWGPGWPWEHWRHLLSYRYMFHRLWACPTKPVGSRILGILRFCVFFKQQPLLIILVFEWRLS